MYKSCMSVDMAGGVLAGIWRKKRKWRKSRVKAVEIFMRSLLSLRFCIILSVSEVCSRFRQSFKESQFRQTHAGQLALRGRASSLDGSGRVKSGQSGKSSSSWSLRLASNAFPRCLCQVNADILSGVYSIPRALLRLPISCQRESGLTVIFSRRRFLHFGTVPLYHRFRCICPGITGGGPVLGW